MRFASTTNAVLTQVGICLQGYLYALEALAVMEGAGGVLTATMRPLAEKAPARRRAVEELLEIATRAPEDPKSLAVLQEAYVELCASHDRLLATPPPERRVQADALAKLCHELKSALAIPPRARASVA